MVDRAKAPRVLLLLEGRDGAGKSTTARDLAEALGPDVCRVRALGAATAEERRGPYFQRWREGLPSAGEVVVLDRSWYGRALVGRVMGFATPDEVETFFEEVPYFEAGLARGGVRLLKVFLKIGEREQARRLDSRRAEGRLSAVDASALAHAEAYDRAEREMIARTSTPEAPWVVVPECERGPRLELLLDHVRRARA